MLKTITFAIMHFTIAFGVVYAMTGSVLLGGAVALIEPSLMKIEGHGIERWLDQGYRVAQQNASGHGIDHTEGDGEMHYCEGNGLEHRVPQKAKDRKSVV